jgi:hypothetical protein
VRKITEIKTDLVTHVSQNAWILELLAKPETYYLLGFFVHFQQLFGGLSKSKGIYLTQTEMAEHMTMGDTQFKKNLKTLVDLGIISSARLSDHPRASSVYFININEPHEFDAKASSRTRKKTDIFADAMSDYTKECTNISYDATLGMLAEEKALCQKTLFEYLIQGKSLKRLVNAITVLRKQEAPFTLHNWNKALRHKYILEEKQLNAVTTKTKQLKELMNR